MVHTQNLNKNLESGFSTDDPNITYYSLLKVKTIPKQIRLNRHPTPDTLFL